MEAEWSVDPPHAWMLFAWLAIAALMNGFSHVEAR